jgi:NADH-quinone oxidoreductase subunit E
MSQTDKAAETTADSATETAQEVAEAASSAKKAIQDEIKEDADKAKDGANTTAAALMSQTDKAVDKAADSAAETAHEVTDAVTDAASSAKEAIQDEIKEDADTAKDAANTAATALMSQTDKTAKSATGTARLVAEDETKKGAIHTTEIASAAAAALMSKGTTTIKEKVKETIEKLTDRSTKENAQSGANDANLSLDDAAEDKDVEVIYTPTDEDKPQTLLEAPRHGAGDNLKRIKGIGVKIEELLNSIGVYHFDQIAAWTEKEAAWIDHKVAFPGRALRDDWIGQAKLLAKGLETEFSKRVDKGEVASSQ